MNITRIMATFGATVPTEPYTNIKVELGFEAELNPDDNPVSAMIELSEMAKQETAVQIAAIKAAKGLFIKADDGDEPPFHEDDIA